MRVPLKRYKTWLAQQPCIKCGKHGVQLHHETGCRSAKTGLPLRRRQNEADAYLLPLCNACHADRHSTSKEGFEESIGHGEGFLDQMVATLYCRYFWEDA